MVALFVVVFVILMLSIDLVIQARAKKYPLMASTPATDAAATENVLRIPKNVFFHPGHTWAMLKSGDSMLVGIDDFVQKAFGRITDVQLPRIGQFVEQGEPVITLASDGKRLSLVAPVSGHVYSINTDAIDNPALLTENPYKEGWLFAVEPQELAANLSVLHVAEKAVGWVREEVTRFREFLFSSVAPHPVVGEAMLDGGIPVSGSLSELDDAQLKQFEETFLR